MSRALATKKAIYLLSFCQHDTLLCLADGLFKSLDKKVARKVMLQFTAKHGKESVQFTCIEPLGANDLRFLQGVVALAGLNGKGLSNSPTNPIPEKLRAGLKTTGELAKKNALFVEVKITQLLKALGMSDGGTNMNSFKASIQRMSTVKVEYKKMSLSASTQLLSFVEEKNPKGFFVALNPRLAEAIQGEVGTRFTRIELHEVRAIKNDATRIIHQRLCGFINQGKSHRLKMDTLCGYVWAKDAAATVPMQRSRLQEALNELGTVGWTVEETTKDTYTIIRPAQVKESH